MVPEYDKKESPYKSLGIWSLMDHSCHAKDAHISRWVKGDLPIARYDR